MIFNIKQAAISSVVTSLFVGVASAKGCGIVRNVDTCNGPYWDDEYYCLMKQNDLKTIMDCVEVKNRVSNLNAEQEICRSWDNGRPDNLEQFYEEDYYTKGEKDKLLCLKPRTVLIRGPLTTPDGWKLGVSGALRSCPEDDPNFHNCLCEHNIKQTFLNQLANFFKTGKTNTLVCPDNAEFRKRTSFLDEIVDTPHLHEARDVGQDVFESYIFSNFTINRKGRPVYDEDPEKIGYPLPYYDTYVSSRIAERCYIHPEINEPILCRQWRLPNTVTSSLSATPLSASYKRLYTPSASTTPTATAAPEQAAIPTESLVVTNNTARAEPPAVSTPTAAAGNTGVALESGSVAKSAVLALMTVACFLWM